MRPVKDPSPCPRSPRPPRPARWILRFLRRYEEIHLIDGDLQGEFKEISAARGSFRASLWYWGQVLYALWADFRQSIWFGGIMIKNFIKINIRNMQRQKLHTLINIAGLALGLTVCTLLVLYIRFERSYDSFHKNKDHIYRINAHDLGRDLKFAATQALLASTLKADFPEIRLAARLVSTQGYFKHENTLFSESKFFCADPDFLDIFTFPLLDGDITARDNPFALYISHDMADKYFPNESPLDKTVRFNNRHEFVIKGILHPIPENSFLHIDMLTPMATLNTLWGDEWLNRWVSHDFNTFVLVEDTTDPEEFGQKLRSFIRPNDIGHEEERDVFYPQPLSQIHFSSGLRNEEGETNDIRYIYLLTGTAALILLIACFNYITLATARATKRTKEIGLRKVVGAERKNLIPQLLGESLLLALLAFLSAVLCVRLLLPAFNQLMNRNLHLNLLTDLPLFLGISLLIGMAAGIYPAFYISAFQPTAIFRGAAGKETKSSAFLNKTLVTFQFFLTIALISSLLIVRGQIGYLIQNSARSFDDPVLTVYLNDAELRKNHEPLLQAFRQSPRVLDSTVSYSHPLNISWGMGMEWEGHEEPQFTRLGPVDFNYIDFYGLKVIKGRKMLPEMGTDKATAALLNETAAEASPWDDPIGKRFKINGREGVVVGIIEDFHFKSLYKEVEPLTLRHMFPEGIGSGAGYISLRISPTDIPGTLKFLEKTWKTHSSYFPFIFSFLDDRIEQTYRTEIRLRRSLTAFTLIAVFLSCLGLFGLASFTAERRTKEIGIRKVLGASLIGILLMLSRDTVKWVILGSLAAFPLAYYAMHEWLKRFVYRIDIGWDPFLLAACASLLIALLATGLQSYKAATADPVRSLRHE